MARITAIYIDRVSTSSAFSRSGWLFNLVAMMLVLAPGTASAFASASLSRVSCSASAYQSAGTDACSVYLTANTNKRFHVYLSSNNPAVTVPSAVTVRAGNSSTGFNASVRSVTTAQTATITANAGSVVKTFSITLSSPITGTPAVSLSANSLGFGAVSVGTAISQSVTLTSSGTAPLTISSDAISGTGFSLLGGNSLPITLNPGQAMVVSVQFGPTGAGSAAGQLTIVSNAGTASVSLSGAGTAAAPTVSALSCGVSSYTGSGTDNCIVSLNSTAPSGGQIVVLTSNNAASVALPSSVTVAPGVSSAPFTANVTWVSTSQTVTLSAAANSSSKSFALQSNAARATLSVNATSIGFGSVYLNTPIEQSVTLSSTGTAPLTVKSVAVSGTGFSESGTSFPVTLNPGQSATVNVQFDPATTGTFDGQLNISSSATADTVPLTGTGQAHQVNLSWIAPTGSTDPVAGYNIYRAPAGTNSFQRVNGNPDRQTVYVDTSMQSGSTYDYVVKSVDANGVESAASNTSTVSVP